MTEVREVDARTPVEATADVTDRRRPGRAKDISPELIPLLRHADAVPAIEFDEVDQVAALRGLGFGVLLSAPIWLAIAYIGRWFLS